VGFLLFILGVLILVYLIIPFVLLNRMADLREHFGSLERALHALDLRLARLATAASAPAEPARSPPCPRRRRPRHRPPSPNPRRTCRRAPYPPRPRPASSATAT
jgi:hypothetical protein